MARRQAKRRKPRTMPRFRRPRVSMRFLLTPLVAGAVVLATYELSAHMLDRPIRSIEIQGPLQRVSALQIEAAVSDELDRGFVTADLDGMRRRIAALAWVDAVTVARRWPSRIRIVVTEQIPAAIWGDTGLLNVRGELFVSKARHIPAELPRLSGPEDRATDVASRYLAVRDRLIPLGLDLRSIRLDARGAWEMTLGNGVEVRLGRRDVRERTDVFLDIVADIITSRAEDINYVDMRYSNGFAIGWKDGLKTPVTDPQNPGDAMVALQGRP